MRHPKPYHVAWIKDENKLFVSEQCVVKFKIINYIDEGLYDIMPMDCGHIILGRPWKYGRHTLHDGKLNQCTLWVNGRKKELIPLIEV